MKTYGLFLVMIIIAPSAWAMKSVAEQRSFASSPITSSSSRSAMKKCGMPNPNIDIALHILLDQMKPVKNNEEGVEDKVQQYFIQGAFDTLTTSDRIKWLADSRPDLSSKTLIELAQAEFCQTDKNVYKLHKNRAEYCVKAK